MICAFFPDCQLTNTVQNSRYYSKSCLKSSFWINFESQHNRSICRIVPDQFFRRWVANNIAIVPQIYGLIPVFYSIWFFRLLKSKLDSSFWSFRFSGIEIPKFQWRNINFMKQFSQISLLQSNDSSNNIKSVLCASNYPWHQLGSITALWWRLEQQGSTHSVNSLPYIQRSMSNPAVCI